LRPKPIPVEDSDSLMEEIDLFLASDDSMPPGIKIDDYDSEGLLSSDSSPLPENESFSLDHFDDPSLPRPPPEPPDVEICFNFEFRSIFGAVAGERCSDFYGIVRIRALKILSSGSLFSFL
ncbi:hypothetical protein Tco_0284237, partial [Tanacetum coccineum]